MVRGEQAGEGRNITLISINIRSVLAAVLLAILAVIGLRGVAASQSADTHWGIAADGQAEPEVTTIVTSATPAIQRDSDWG
ncbi:hypothetical protein [Streptomyces yangpuensis]|uniref:hypothetical protein n=1 Tax=Streptomyces yangpuensis TaxID=1648182 RepID=UPI003665C3DF